MREEAFAAARHAAFPSSTGAAHVQADAIETRWNDNRLSTASVDKGAAEEGVRLAYGAAGLDAPRIVWHDGPISLAMSWASAGSRAGINMHDAIIDAPYQGAIERLEQHGNGDAAILQHRFSRDWSCAVSASVYAAVIEDASSVRLSFSAWLDRLKLSWATKRRAAGFVDGGSGQHELCWLGFTASLLEMLEARAIAGLSGVLLIAENAGWIMPHADTCWLSDRPSMLSFDEWGRLHSSSGPALCYRDGWSAYSWKGTRVPSWIIDEPERITLRWIDAQIDPMIRRAMIDIMTPKAFLEAGGAQRVASDGTGTLWIRKWFYRGSVIDTWAAVEFPAPDGGCSVACVPTHLRTPREALVWLFTKPGVEDQRAPS